jgi:hypothetical protein
MTNATLDVYAGLFRRPAMRAVIAEAARACPAMQVEVAEGLLRTDWTITGPSAEVKALLRAINETFGHA